MTLRIEDLPEPMRAKVAAEHPELVGRRRKRVARPAGPSDLEREMAYNLRAAGYPTPVQQHRPVEGRRWTLDFSWPDRKLAVECDGGTWLKGQNAHGGGTGIALGYLKANELAIQGWVVLRFDTAMVQDGRALEALARAWEATA